MCCISTMHIVITIDDKQSLTDRIALIYMQCTIVICIFNIDFIIGNY